MANYTNGQNFTAFAEDNSITGTVIVTVASGETTYSHVLSGTGRLRKQGTGKLILSGANTFEGGILISEGEVEFANEASVGTQPTVADADYFSLSTDTTLGFAGNSNDIKIDLNEFAGITLTGNATINNDLNNNNRGGNLTINGPVVGAHTLTIDGGDLENFLPSVILNGTNTGTTLSIDSGVNLTLDGSYTGAVTLNGDLSGSGTITGDVTTNAGSRLLPGSTVGSTLAITGNLSTHADSFMYFGIQNDLTDGTTLEFDKLTISGATALAGEIHAVSYNDLITGTPVIITSTGSLTNNTPTFVSDEFYSDGNELTTNGSLTRTATGAVSGNTYIVTIS